MSAPSHQSQKRALLVTSSQADATLVCEVLSESGVYAIRCQSIAELCTHIEDDVDFAVIAETDVTPDSYEQLRNAQTNQPAWCNLPLILIRSNTFERHFNWSWEDLVDDDVPVQPIVLEQPLQRHEVARAIRSSVKSRAGQHDIKAEMRRRKAVEAELRISRRRYVDLVEGVDAVVYEREPVNCHFTFVSQQAVGLLGYPLSRWLIEPNFWIETVVHEEDRTKALEAVSQVCDECESTHFEYRARHADGSVLWLRDALRVNKDRTGEIEALSGLIFDITERKEYERQLRLLMRELNHRVRNTLATVQAMALQTIRHCDSLSQFSDSFQKRLRSMAQAHSLLSQREWRSVKLRKLLEKELAAQLASFENVRMSGPEVALRPKAALALHMIIHELTTNAAKYGALSGDHGVVTTNWSIVSEKQAKHLLIKWVESDGPKVAPPTRRGFGTEVFEETVEYELDGRVEIRFDPNGLQCDIYIPQDIDTWHIEESTGENE